MPLMWFNFYCAYSSQTIYDDYYITCYNLIFTCWPLLINALFDKDFDYLGWTTGPKDPKTNRDKYEIPCLEKNVQFLRFMPYLYYSVYKRYDSIYRLSFLWLFISFSISTILFFIIIYSVNDLFIGSNGYTADIWFTSLTLYTGIL